MAANVENMFSARGISPWHKEGVIFQGNPTFDEAVAAVPEFGMTVSKMQHQLTDGRLVNAYSIVREDGKIVGECVKERYVPLTVREAFGAWQSLFDTGVVTLETGGTLCDGSKAFLVGRFTTTDNGVVVSDDQVVPYLTFATSFDGTLANVAMISPTRVVCSNTLAAALGNSKGKNQLKLKHTKNAKEGLKVIGEMVDAANHRFSATMAQYRELCRHDVRNKADLKRYVQTVFAIPSKGAPAAAETPMGIDFDMVMSARRQPNGIALEDVFPVEEANKRIYETVEKHFEQGIGQDMRGARGTYWGAYNAVTQFLTHDSGRTADARLNSGAFGVNAARNSMALETALSMVSI